MDLQRRQTTWLGDLPRENPNPVTKTPEAKRDKRRPPPLRLSTHPSPWAKLASSLGGQSDSQWSPKLNSEDPWHRFRKILEIRVGGPAVLAKRKSPGKGLVAIRRHVCEPREAEAKLYMIKVLQHEHFQSTLEVFLGRGELWMVSLYVQISVFEIIRAYLDPSEPQVACVARQVG